MPRKKAETYRANAKVSKEIWDKIIEVSEELGLSASSVVRMSIIKGLEKING